MMFKGVIAAIFASLLAAAPAQAVVLAATFTGKVTITHYADDTFGTSDLTGLDYTATYLFDPGVGTINPPWVGCAGCFDQIIGGLSPNVTIKTVSITINGLTDVINFQAPAYAQTTIEHVNNPFGPNSGIVFSGAAGEYVPGEIYPGTESYSYFSGGSSYNAPVAMSPDWTAPWSPPAGGTGSSGFLKQVQNVGRGYDQAYNFGGSVLSARIGAVPEPGAWLLMIFGIGVLGSALRRRPAFAP
jgi:hypothetical protein